MGFLRHKSSSPPWGLDVPVQQPKDDRIVVLCSWTRLFGAFVSVVELSNEAHELSGGQRKSRRSIVGRSQHVLEDADAEPFVEVVLVWLSCVSTSSPRSVRTRPPRSPRDRLGTTMRTMGSSRHRCNNDDRVPSCCRRRDQRSQHFLYMSTARRLFYHETPNFYIVQAARGLTTSSLGARSSNTFLGCG